MMADPAEPPMDPTATEHAAQEPFRDAAATAQKLLTTRLGEYQQIWEDATAKMMTGTYRSEDLVEDWFAWWGHAARDMTAAATLAFGSASQMRANAGDQRPRPGTGDQRNRPDGGARNGE